MEDTVMLPAGTFKIPVKEIPWKIAETVISEKKATTKYITAIRKKYTALPGTHDGYDGYVFEELTDKDWKFLYIVCGLADLPPVRKGKEIIEISLSQWKHYEDAFENACKENEKDWKVESYSNSGLKIAADKHKQFLTDAVKKGDVVVNNGETCIPLQQPINLVELDAAYMALNEFKKFVNANFHLQVYVGEIVAGQVDALHTSSIPIATTKEEYISKTKQQENIILKWLSNNGYNPLEFPPPPQGQAGVKTVCRKELLGNNKQLFSSSSVFNTAWERLRANGAIKDAK